MAEITNVTYLQRRAAGAAAFTKLVDITSYPDMGGTPEQIDITTLSDRKLRNMNGLQAGDALEFGALYKKEDYELLEGIMQADRQIVSDSELATYRLLFGDNGQNGIFEWQGKLSVFAVGGEPNARRDMTITISDEGEDELHYVDPSAPVVDVTGVTLNKSTTTINVGSAETLIATVEPSDASNPGVTWSSDDTTVAVVDQSGRVVGMSAGTANITATTVDGEYTDTCAVTIEAVVVPVTGVSLDQTTLSLEEGEDATLTATVEPSDATDKTGTWSSDDDNTATVDQTGKVLAIAAGSATITFTTTAGSHTATCNVTVTAS